MKKILFAVLAVVISVWFINLKTTSTIGSQSEPEGFDAVSSSETPSQGTLPQLEDIDTNQAADVNLNPKVFLLKDILASKNDNDPRLDTEFRNLSDEEKEALKEMYTSMRAESLNDRGTVVFLMGRELTRPEDAEFLKQVLSEEPCLSLSNCAITNAERDPHHDSVNDLTLSYPQLVALNRIKAFVGQKDLRNVNPTILSHLADAAKIGQNSRIPLVQARANEIISLLEARN